MQEVIWVALIGIVTAVVVLFVAAPALYFYEKHIRDGRFSLVIQSLAMNASEPRHRLGGGRMAFVIVLIVVVGGFLFNGQTRDAGTRLAGYASELISNSVQLIRWRTQ